MWNRTNKIERLPNGMPLLPFVCDHCGAIFRFLEKPDGMCYRCGKIHTLFINNRGEIQTIYDESLQIENDD